ncbi:hypothetical protein TcCL_Unassigned00272, partial [Trypanosoma cruzi]
THHRSAVSLRVRGFGPPHNRRIHRQQSTTNDKEEKRHTATVSSSVPRPTVYGHSPAANTQHARSKLSHKVPHAEAGPHPPMTRRLTPCGHTECTDSPIERIRRPSLKAASVIDGP